VYPVSSELFSESSSSRSKSHTAAKGKSSLQNQSIKAKRTNTMLPVRDITPPGIYAASCFEDNDHSTTKDSTAGENMMLKQPLITMTNESVEGEGQTKLQRSVIWKSFLLGSSTGFALQVMACAAYYTLFKMFAKDPQPTTGSLLSSFSYYLLVLTSQLHLAIYFATWVTAIYTSTKSGSLYMRKKFDKDAANPNSDSIGATHVVGVYFLTGVHAGSFSILVIVDVCIGMVIPLMPLMFLLMTIDFVALLLTAKCFDWSDLIEHELEDDHSWVV
jgi:hypothetical protein